MAKQSVSESSLPRLTVSPRGATRLKSGHAWVYRSDISSANGIAPGSLVTVADPKGKPLGIALYSSSSQIAIRLLAPGPVENFPELIRERIRQAIAYRKLVVSNTDAYRIVFSEADFLPGLIVDRYNDIVAFQVLTQAMDSEAARQALVSELCDRLNPAAVVERVDPRVRRLEQLSPRNAALVHGENTNTIFTMNGVRFHYAALEGQKTGSCLDQRENYDAATQYAYGDSLDGFCYQGGFA